MCTPVFLFILCRISCIRGPVALSLSLCVCVSCLQWCAAGIIMYRRVHVHAAALQVRAISEYKFGQAPLTKPWGNVVHFSPPAPSKALEAQKVKVSQLHNGARVITQQREGAMVSVGAYILAGPAYDPVGCPGVHGLMHVALTTSNYNNSLFQLDRGIRSTGAAFSHFEKDKHFIGIRLDARADMWKSQNTGKKNDKNSFTLNLVQDTIFTAIAAPRFHEADIERFRDTVDNNLKEMKWQQPEEYVMQKVETVAFHREPLGNPRHVPENNNGNITSKILMEHYSQYVTPERVIIAGVNVNHDELIAEYENTPYPHSKSAPHHAAFEKQNSVAAFDINAEKNQYTGGEAHEHENRAKEMGTKPDMDNETIVAVGYLSFGRGMASIKRYAAALVYQQLYNVLIQDTVRGAFGGSSNGIHSFYLPYQSAGLIGFTARSEPQDIVKMVTAGMRDMQSVKTDNATAVEAAKHRAAVDFMSRNLETVRDLCDYLGTSLPLTSMAQNSTQYMKPEEVIDAIRSVTPEELKQVKECAMGSKPSLFGHGEMLAFPSLRQMGF
ncbi:mitochondrial processing peptidase alpha subunit, putative [Trypanosoma cruzi]|uniref:Mitochondrial processing peptidase alpha subunit, putative n=2 Tax=Trypanosoma cruzi TaxID=5693 RepID=Q4DB63_TRYCC|nr:mitochondrial processing peptidase alpha subunit, putative [Trypanosoma cruzi]EAN89758.1 mitochondrial processing peptidase alpha subunit, putative [Trypanosoma cruzi]|eukprot:XP_811609.1 mitochondrial processing peptidase alpha subunit [Trypanosoma cruzi strain CL Brener]